VFNSKHSSLFYGISLRTDTNSLKRRMSYLRYGIFCILAFVLCDSAFAHSDRIEAPKTVSIGFSTGQQVRFTVSGDNISKVAIQVGRRTFSVPDSVAAKLRSVRFDTLRFLWDENVDPSRSFYIRFEMGSETARRFGDLPVVECHFKYGKFYGASVTRKTSVAAAETGPLMPVEP
jgi:hypothetical protein